jgi:hypothetical protein
MNLQDLKAKFDADLASMSQEELIQALESAGCVFDDPWLFSAIEAGVQSNFGVPMVAENSNELALAA